MGGIISGMASQREGLLTRIEQGVVDPETKLSSLLNMCLVLGGQAKSEKMRDWARKELNGYPDGKQEDFPPYRRIPAVITIRITNLAGYNPITQNIRNADLPDVFTNRFDTEEMVLDQGVSELEALVRSGDQARQFTPAWAPLLCKILNEHPAYAHNTSTSRVVDAYWMIGSAPIEGALGRVRSALADLVAELVAETPDDQAVPDKLTVDRAVQFIVTGERTVINFTTQHAGEGGTNTAAPAVYESGPITVSTGGGTTIGSQNANSGGTVTGSQNAGDHSVVTGRDTSTSPETAGSKDGWWTRLRKRGAIVAISTILGGVASIVAAVAAVWALAGWPWPWS